MLSDEERRVLGVERYCSRYQCELDRLCMQHVFANYGDSSKPMGPVMYARAQV